MWVRWGRRRREPRPGFESENALVCFLQCAVKTSNGTTIACLKHLPGGPGCSGMNSGGWQGSKERWRRQVAVSGEFLSMKKKEAQIESIKTPWDPQRCTCPYQAGQSCPCSCCCACQWPWPRRRGCGARTKRLRRRAQSSKGPTAGPRPPGPWSSWNEPWLIKEEETVEEATEEEGGARRRTNKQKGQTHLGAEKKDAVIYVSRSYTQTQREARTRHAAPKPLTRAGCCRPSPRNRPAEVGSGG